MLALVMVQKISCFMEYVRLLTEAESWKLMSQREGEVEDWEEERV